MFPLPTSTVASTDATKPVEASFWTQPSTRWDLVKFCLQMVLPALVAVVVFVATLYFSNDAHSKELAEHQQKIATLQESRQNIRMDLVELKGKVDQLQKDTNEVKGDVKSLLRRSR